MALEHPPTSRYRTATCALGALLIHCGLAAALPARPVVLSAHEQRRAEHVWMEASITFGGSRNAGRDEFSPGVDAPPRASARRAAELRSEAPRLASEQRTANRARFRKASADSFPQAEPLQLANAGFRADLAALAASISTLVSSGAAPLAGAGPAPSANGSGVGAGDDGGAASSGQGSGRAGNAHGPGLLAYGNPCAGFFPSDARADHGEVQLSVDVDTEGHPRASTVVIERPRGEGFGSAARACAQRLHFVPAVDQAGAPMRSHTKLRLRFDRRSTVYAARNAAHHNQTRSAATKFLPGA